MNFLAKHHRQVFFTAWILINILQAFFTELFHDEAYYWVYSRFPDWGYYDHPPMIAWLIKIGYSIFPNELGVRLLCVILNTATIYIISLMLSKKDDFLFYGIAGSVAVAHIGGMITVPDIPLIFFTALWFYTYRRFADNSSWTNTFLLALSAALLLYSKYHGVLIIFFTLLSNIKILAQSKIYVAGIIGALLFAPHLYWQWQHDFPSVQYHLYERNASKYHFSFTLEYIFGQIALVGPVIGWLFLWLSAKYRPANPMEKALKFTLWGILIFFLISSLKGRVEANWTLPVLVCLIILSHQAIIAAPRWKKWVYYSLPVTLLIVLIGRIILIYEIPIAGKVAKHNEFHHNIEWVAEVDSIAGDNNVVFINSYQRPSKFWFYAQRPAYGLNTGNYRRNNYNFWPLEEAFIGKPAYIFGHIREEPFKLPLKESENGGYIYTPRFFSFGKVQILLGAPPTYTNRAIHISALIVSPEEYLMHFKDPAYANARMVVFLKDEEGSTKHFTSQFTVESIEYSEQYVQVSFPVPDSLSAGKYFVRFGIESVLKEHPSLNSTGYVMELNTGY